MKKIAVILCGCGSMDGSEIHEATFALAAIDELNAQYECFALDEPQARVMNFITAQPESNETRNQLKEAARIARGKIQNLNDLLVENFDALLLPGGFGAAFNLCNFASMGSEGQVKPQVVKAIKSFKQANKPIGAICIAPALLALTLGKELTDLTITAGNVDDEAAVQFEKLGCKVLPCDAADCVIDSKNKIVSTPAYMNAKRISDVRKGIYKLVEAVLKMV